MWIKCVYKLFIWCFSLFFFFTENRVQGGTGRQSHSEVSEPTGRCHLEPVVLRCFIKLSYLDVFLVTWINESVSGLDCSIVFIRNATLPLWQEMDRTSSRGEKNQYLLTQATVSWYIYILHNTSTIKQFVLFYMSECAGFWSMLY